VAGVFQQILKAFFKTFLREGIVNSSTQKAIKIYQTDGNYPGFYRNFVGHSDNGRSSLRLANTFSLKIVSIKLDDTRISAGDSICCQALLFAW
jgi:hypothetical protein